jgi:hypothetical protein
MENKTWETKGVLNFKSSYSRLKELLATGGEKRGKA